jgi:hypothetical protein
VGVVGCVSFYMAKMDEGAAHRSTISVLTKRCEKIPLEIIMTSPSSSVVELVLDPQIRDYVLLPIVLIMFFISLFRHYVSILISSEKKLELKKVMEGCAYLY